MAIELRVRAGPPLDKREWKRSGRPAYRLRAVFHGGDCRWLDIGAVPAWRPIDVPCPLGAIELADVRRFELLVARHNRENLVLAIKPDRLVVRGPDHPPPAAGTAVGPQPEEETLATSNAGPVPTLPAPPRGPAPADPGPALYVPGTYRAEGVPLIRYQPDPVFEAELGRLQIGYRLDPAYPLARVDVEASLANTARPHQTGGIDEERAAQLVAAARSIGTLLWKPLALVEAPAFMGPRPGDRPAVLMGGNHRRYCLAELKIPTAAAYVLDPAVGELTFRALSAFHNQTEGAGIDEKQRLELAYAEARQVYKAGSRPEFEKISVRWGVTVRGSLSRIFNARLLQERLSASGDLSVPGYQRLSESYLAVLQPLVKFNDSVRQLARGLAEMRKLAGIEDVRKLVTEAKAETDAAARRQLIEKRLDVMRQEAGGALGRLMLDKSGRSADSLIRLSASKLTNLLDHRLPSTRDVKDVVPNPAERTALREHLEALRARLDTEIGRLA